MGMASLETFLRMYHSGQGTLSPEMFQHFGGEDLLKQVQQFDPSAQWSDADMGGGEGGSQGMGKRLDFDITKMPTPKHSDVLNLRPANYGSKGLHNDKYQWADENYGQVTESKNIKREVSGIEKYAPLIAAAISMGGPALGAALAGAGIGGAAGLTAGVTGSGLTGVNAFNLPNWLVQQMAKLPQTAGKISQGKFDFTSLLPMAGSAAGLDPNLMRGAQTLSQLARR
jgi:hypothetical protein